MRARTGLRWLTIAATSLLVGILLAGETGAAWKRREDKTKCPKVKGIRNFDISEVRRERERERKRETCELSVRRESILCDAETESGETSLR